MEAKAYKRIFAYTIDVIILFIVSYILVSVLKLVDNNIINNLNNELSNIHTYYLDKNIDFLTYIKEYANVTYLIEKKEIYVNILNLILTIIMFILIPFFTKGQTIGKLIMKIKIVKKDGSKLGLKDLFLRSLIINFLLYSLLSIISILLFKSMVYFIISFILIILEVLLVIISGFMILYRSKKEGIHDIILGTSVINIKR